VPAGKFAILLLTLGAASMPVAAVPVLTQEARVLLTVALLPASGDATGVVPAARAAIEIPPARSVGQDLTLSWPDPGATTHVHLDLSGTAGPEGGEHEVALDARIELPDGRVVRTSRAIRIREGSTQIVDLYSEKGHKLLLAAQAERTSRPVVLAGAQVGTHVRFRLEVSRVDGEVAVPLESNVMDTFVGQGVEYSFRRGDGDELESMGVVLTPTRIDGEIVDIGVEVSGTLPADPERIVVSRKERLIATRGASSAVTVLAGPGRGGYRFAVTADF
jgi:hypothetical protein